MMATNFAWVQRINFTKTLSVLTTTFIFHNFKTSFKNIFIKKNYLK